MRETTNRTRRQGTHDLAVAAGLLAGIASAWWLSRQGLFRSGDDLSYWVAVAGGTMMLLVFLYPLRKHLPAARHWGAARAWLWVHIAFGLLGPWLILLHSTFRIGSLNAGVALASMAIVVLSGVVGRFLYVRVNRDLAAERRTLRGLTQAEIPAVEAELAAFERVALERHGDLYRLVRLPWLRRRAERHCRPHLRGADARDARLRVRQRLAAAQRVAQVGAWERLFALWHVAHLPFVVLLVVSAVVHVVAVHAY
jgi:hypothetical protein